MVYHYALLKKIQEIFLGQNRLPNNGNRLSRPPSVCYYVRRGIKQEFRIIFIETNTLITVQSNAYHFIAYIFVYLHAKWKHGYSSYMYVDDDTQAAIGGGWL